MRVPKARHGLAQPEVPRSGTEGWEGWVSGKFDSSAVGTTEFRNRLFSLVTLPSFYELSILIALGVIARKIPTAFLPSGECGVERICGFN